MEIKKCRRCKEKKKIVGFGYCMECAKALGAVFTEEFEESQKPLKSPANYKQSS